MLRLDKLHIVGFKSFGDRTEVVFPEGITAVVGPNGCGKSNIGDALNWVLGEQSAKMLRGSSMGEVIFNGSEKRKPVGMAEVSLHLSSTNGAPQPREVVLTRRLFRDGESEYLVNGQRSRLKDIQDLMREAHVGAKTYATIEQGRIDQILNAKPKDRRLIIEEAAGIAGFKQKRRLTELKLDATQANLLRVNDIVGEVRRQINSLKRQAAKARRYRRLRDELRVQECLLFGLRARQLDADLERLRHEETLARDAEAEAAAHLASLDAETSADRQAIEDLVRRLQEARESLHQVEMIVGEEESRVRACRDRIAEGEQTAARLDDEAADLAVRRGVLEEEAVTHRAAELALRRELDETAARLAARQIEFEEADHALSEARERIEALRRRLFESMSRAADGRNRKRAIEEALERNAALRARRTLEREAARGDFARFRDEAENLRGQEGELRRAVGELEASHDETGRRLADARGRLSRESEDLGCARDRETSVAARLLTLEDVATRFAGVSDGVRVLLTSGSAAGVRTLGVVADYVVAGEDIEAAAEMYLDGLLPAVVLEDDADARNAAALLQVHDAGRTSFLSRTHPVGEPAIGARSNGHSPFPEGILQDPRVLGRLKDRIRFKGANGFLQDRIGDAILVDSIESALELHRLHPHADYLSPAGDVVYSSGVVMSGGRRNGDHGLLAHTRRIHQARAEQAEAASMVGQSHARVEACREDVARIDGELADVRHRLEEGRRRLVEVGLRSQRSTDEVARTDRAAEILAQEIESLADEARALEDHLAGVREEVAAAERAHATLEAEHASGSSDLDRLEAGLRRLAEETSVLRVEAAARTQALLSEEREGARRDEAMRDLVARAESARSEAAAARQRVLEAAELLARTESAMAQHLRERESRGGAVATDEEALAERREALVDREEGLRVARASLEDDREQARSIELARMRADGDRRHLDDLCVQELNVGAAEAAASAGEALESADAGSVEGEIRGIRERIDSIGPVNMTAIDEFTELEQRHAFLETQRQDLEQAMASLRDTIRRINSASRDQFSTAFEAIRTSYQEIFQVLFGGGRADLRLEEGEDVLESGVEILAQPPGKRLSNVHLLSGGEKAMSAIALLFAIFRYQPSPFCLLDEVDAALDDVNVNRFTRMLREYSGSTQFILITHNKLSMDSANLLYGVTMQEPGVSRVVSLELDA